MTSEEGVFEPIIAPDSFPLPPPKYEVGTIMSDKHNVFLGDYKCNTTSILSLLFPSSLQLTGSSSGERSFNFFAQVNRLGWMWKVDIVIECRPAYLKVSYVICKLACSPAIC